MSIQPLTTLFRQRAKAEKTFLRCLLLFLREMLDGLPKSMCPHSAPWNLLLKKWTVFTLFGKRIDINLIDKYQCLKELYQKQMFQLMLLCFRYNFESWREFSYLDEEEKDKAEW